MPPASTAAWQQSLLKHGNNESGRRYGNDDQGHGAWVNKGKRKGQSPMLGFLGCSATTQPPPQSEFAFGRNPYLLGELQVSPRNVRLANSG